jgi:hypothetical protein
MRLVRQSWLKGMIFVLDSKKSPKGWWESTVFVYAHQSNTWLYKNP